MPVTTPCTNRESLRALLERGGTDQEIAQLESHLQQCDRCGELFEEMVRDDEVTQSVRGAKHETESDIPALKGLCERLSRLRPMRQKQENTVGDERTLPPTPRNQAPEDVTESGLDFLAPAQQADELGRLGNYRILKKLGAGGMGMVFLAEDMQLHRKVALKTMLPGYAMNTVAKDRFLREARAAAAVEHENIVAIHQVGEDRGVPYLAMPFLKGESLEDRLDREQKLPLREALRIAAEMAEGLAAAHENGLIHRDIKPGNVWLEGEPRKVKLLDFGLARSRTDDTRLTQSGTIVGTPAFMAPEQAKGEDIDGRADLFSLGCVLYVMLTGQRPFKGNDTISLLMALALENPPTPQVINHDVPDAVGEMTMSLLAKDVNQRPASAKEAAKTLRGLVEAGDDRKTAVKPRAAKAPTAAKPAPGKAAPDKPSSAKAAPGKPSSKTATMPKVVAEEAETPPKRSRKPMVLAGLLLLVGIIAAAGIILRLQTDKGELVLEAGDESIEITVKQAGKQPVVLVLDKNTKRTLELTVREGEIEARELPDGVRFKTSKFEMDRGGRKVFTASMLLAQAPLKPPIDDGGKKDPPTGAREKPFVLMSKGAETGEFEKFNLAFEKSKPGDDIVVYANGPFNLPRVTVKDRALVLRAAPGFRPVFQMDESVLDRQDLAWIHLEKGSVTIDGCDLVVRNLPREKPNPFFGGEGPCVLRNGRFLGMYLLGNFKGSSLTVEDSLLLLQEMGKLPPGCEATLTNNLIGVGMLIGDLTKPGGQTIRLTRNAIVNKVGAPGSGLILCPPYAAGVTVIAEGNLIDFNKFITQPVLPEGFKGRMRWQGKNNLYVDLYKGGLEKWNEQLAEPEVNSRVVDRIPFAWTLSHLKQAEQALSLWGTRLAQARRESGLPGLGPDLSLLGPGEAYLRARAADGKAVPMEQLRPEPLAGGRVALLRGGKEEKGFHKLQDAFDAAKDGDILEIRTDAQLVGARTRKDSGNLTLRAAPGYLPVITDPGIVVETGTALSVEGLAFRNAMLATVWGPMVAPAKQGRVPRLVSCSFDPHEVSNIGIQCLLQGSDGSVGEVARCICIEPTVLQMQEGVHVRFRECLFSDAIPGPRWTSPVGKYELDHCIVYQPRHYNILLPTAKVGSRWMVRNSLLESNGHVMAQSPQEWTGEKNHIRSCYAWSTMEFSRDLAQWRQLPGVKETGTVQGEPWIADPQSWKLTDQSIPDGVGPDISRIGRPTTDRTVEPKPALKVREKAFALVRKGSEAGEFKTFEEAWAKHEVGDEIVVHGDGPFVLSPVTVKGRDLVLRGAPGFRPRFLTAEDVFNRRNSPWFMLQGAGLTLDGCDFVVQDTPPNETPPGLVSGDGPCVLRNGRFLGFQLLLSNNNRIPSLTLEDNLLCLTHSGLGVLQERCEVTLTNNLYLGSVLIAGARQGGQTIRLTRNAFVSTNYATWIPGLPNATEITIIAEGNHFEFSRDLPTNTNAMIAPTEIKAVRWKGKNNVYCGLKDGLAKWNELTGEPEVGSKEVPRFPFEWLGSHFGMADPALAESTLAEWSRRLEQQRKAARMPDLGPDLSLVGPGEAYVRALARDGKPVSKESLRPAPLPTGRIALLRQGKPVGGFHELKPAFDAAKDGDVIEIRADARLAGCETPKEVGNLTLRAAPGYRPVISGKHLHVRMGTALSLEGLAFANDASLNSDRDKAAPLEKQGLVPRIASCSFDYTPTRPSVSGLLRASDGKPGEITRCVILGQIGWRYVPGAHVRMKDCLIGCDSYTAVGNDPADGRYEMTNCIFSNPRPAKFILGAKIGYAKSYRWEARNTLFDSSAFFAEPGDWGWGGEKNVYRITLTQGLRQWKLAMKSEEPGSVEADPLIFDPSQWRLVSGNPAEGTGPDVTRVARRAQGPDIKQPVQADPNPVKPGAPREKAFVLLRQGKEAGEFKTFAAAWEQHQPGDEIVVYGNGPFALPRVTVKGKALVLRAAPGFHPLFQTDETFFDQRGGVWIDLQKGSLTTEGCDFAHRDLPPGIGMPPSLVGGEGPCVLRNGRFLLKYSLLGGGLASYTGPSLTIEDSLLILSSYGLGVLPPGCQVNLSNNLILTGTLFHSLAKPGGQTVRLIRNAIVPHLGSTVHAPLEGNQITMDAEGNLFDFRSTSLSVLQDGFEKHIRWQGKNNVYVRLSGGLEKWNAKLPQPEVNSRDATDMPFPWATSPEEAGAALAWGEKRLTQARQESGLPDLGPDLSLLGPGEAYLRSLSQDGKPVPKERVRPDALPGGRVALLRQGKEVGGFPQLQEAFDAALEGDVLEIRSDAKLPGGRTRKDSGSLTLRAAPGYRPVINGPGLTVQIGTGLEVEGLAFARDAMILTQWDRNEPLAKQGRISRLVSCSFERAGEKTPASLQCLLLGSRGEAAEMVRCVVLGTTEMRFVEGCQVRFRECLFLDFIGYPTDDPALGRYEVDRCIVCRPRPRARTALLNEGGPVPPKTKFGWTVRNSLLDHTEHLTVNSPVNWTGEKNLYRIARGWPVTGGTIQGLKQWRAVEGVKETGSVERDPWVCDPESWLLPPGTVPDGVGPDVSRIGRMTGE